VEQGRQIEKSKGEARLVERQDRQMLATAMSHPTRVRILIAMNTPRRRLSPKEFACEEELPVAHCAYHFRRLSKSGCIVLVTTRQRRGATEHIYEARERALAWTNEWESLKPELKRTILQSVLGRGVRELGSAIDSRIFEKHPESHLSWNSMQVDERGWEEMAALFDGALKRLIRIEEECLERIAAGARFFLMSYFMVSFESPRIHDPFAQIPGRPKEAGVASSPTRDKARLRRRALKHDQKESQLMAKAMSHPTRVRILMAMNTPRRRLSPKQFATETGLEVQHCAYHFRELEDYGCVSLVATRQRRGVEEHIYEAHKAALHWTDDWKRLGPAVKQTVLASVMRGAVEALGSAIANGTFEARPESHLSYSTIEVDERGWHEISHVYDNLLLGLMRLDEGAQLRVADGADYFVASYFMATFESPRKRSSAR
jgi:hypothetical protein